MKHLNQKLATENAIITQADKDPCSLQTKAGYQLNQPKKSIQERKLYVMKGLNQNLAKENAIITQADKGKRIVRQVGYLQRL